MKVHGLQRIGVYGSWRERGYEKVRFGMDSRLVGYSKPCLTPATRQAS